jgi:hypothetical protein
VTEPRSDRRRLERQLGTALAGTTAYLVLVGTGSIVAVLVLIGPTKSSDLARVAALALCGGTLGATVRALYEIMGTIEAGVWELSDGTIVQRRLRRSARARQTFLQERSESQPAAGDRKTPEGEEHPDDEVDEDELPRGYLSRSERAALAAREAERQELGLTKVKYNRLKNAESEAEKTQGFSIYDIPWLILYPLLGAALGLIAFAGLISGFLVASGAKSATYSPAGLLFVAVLAGMFSPNFISALARAADAIFGKTDQPPTRSLSAPPPEERI